MFSRKLKATRERCGLTQKQISDVLSIDRSTYSYYETGKSYPTLETLIKLAKIFQVSMDELVDYQSVSEPETLSFADNMPAYNVGITQEYNHKITMLSKEEQNLLIEYRILSEDSKQEIRRLAADLAKQT